VELLLIVVFLRCVYVCMSYIYIYIYVYFALSYNMRAHTCLPIRRGPFVWTTSRRLREKKKKLSKRLARGETKTENKSFFFATSRRPVDKTRGTDMTSAIYGACHVVVPLILGDFAGTRARSQSTTTVAYFFSAAIEQQQRSHEPHLTETRLLRQFAPEGRGSSSDRKTPHELKQYYYGIVYCVPGHRSCVHTQWYFTRLWQQ
jgi:hypothetical protein